MLMRVRKHSLGGSLPKSGRSTQFDLSSGVAQQFFFLFFSLDYYQMTGNVHVIAILTRTISYMRRKHNIYQWGHARHPPSKEKKTQQQHTGEINKYIYISVYNTITSVFGAFRFQQIIQQWGCLKSQQILV